MNLFHRTTRIAPLPALLSVVTLLCLPTDNLALDPAKAIARYSHAVWQDRDGLPENTIQAIVQTRDGYLWLGTEVGLARFDGARFTVFDKQNTPGLKNSNVTALLEARDGALWIGTRGGGVTRLAGGAFTTWTEAEGLADNSVRALGEDRQGGVWVGTNDGLSRFAGGKLTNFGVAEGLPADGIRAVLCDRRGRLWVGTTSGLARLEGGRFVAYAARDGMPAAIVRALCEDISGAVWVGMQEAGLARFADGRLQTFTTRDGLPSDSVRSLFADRDGGVWVGTFGGGLGRYSGGRFDRFTSAQGLGSDIVRSLYEDREGSVWAGTEGGGVSRFTLGKATTWTTRDGLSHDFIRAVRQDAGGALWVGTEGGGINILRDGRVTTLTTRDGLLSDFVASVCEDSRGRVWVGTMGGLHCFEGGRLTRRYTRRDGLPGQIVYAVTESRDGGLWLGTPSGLARLGAGGMETFTLRDGLPHANVRALFEDRAGRLWIATRERGLARRDGDRIAPVLSPAMPPGVHVTSFHEDADGVLWLGSNNGLLRFENGTFVSLTTRDGLFHDNILQVLEDRHGNLWLASSSGVFYVSRRELNDAAAKRIARVNSVSFTAADGMKSAECSSDAQPAGWLARDGRLWFPTVKGLVEIDPAAVRRNELPPPVHVERVVADGRAVNPGGFFRLPAGTEDVEFHYAGLSFVAPERVRFKYRLEGLEEDWTEAGARRAAFYTNLAPGRYRFRVIAANNDGVWNEAGAGVEFYLEPRFHQTLWFYLLCAGALGLVVWGLLRVRVRRIRREFEAVAAERNRIAREWHDTLVAGFAAIAWQLEALAARIPASAGVAHGQLEVARKMVKHSLTEARRALWDLRSNAAENGNLAATLYDTSQRLVAGKPLELDFKVDGEAAKLPGDVETNLLRIGQEAVSNAASHAGARRVEVRLSFGPQEVRLQVSDDGCGFDPGRQTANGGHFGLTGMRERALKFGGEFALDSRPGAGTEVVVRVPLGKKLTKDRGAHG
jgi:ligand-binding sensor domain-containing protein/signal transduction histidine kinase